MHRAVATSLIIIALKSFTGFWTILNHNGYLYPDPHIAIRVALLNILFDLNELIYGH
jgi:hypothetical protein